VDDARNPPPPVGPYDPEAWARWMKDVMGRRTAAAYERPAVALYASMVARQTLEAFDATKPAYQLAKVLPRDVQVLRDFVLDKGQSLDRRGRVLEVIILRGSHLQWPYEVMVRLLSGPLLTEQPLRRETEEKLLYQREAVDLLVKNEPELFHRIATSPDRLPTATGGLYPATEWMSTHLREGGLLGRAVVRNSVFTPWLERLPARDRGRAMFHVADAAGAQERGRVTYLGYVTASALAGTFGLTWSVADSHWHSVADDLLGKVERGLGYSYEAGPDPAKGKDREEFYRGYVLAGRRLA